MALAIAYARYSTEFQDDTSIETQFDEMRKGAAKEGDTFYTFLDDKARTGQTTDREGYNKVLELVSRKELGIKKIYVMKFSRFLRDDLESALVKARLDRLGVQLVSVMEPLPAESYMSDFMRGMIALADKFFCQVVGVHVRAGMQKLTRNGYWPGGPAPYGYKIITLQDREGKTNKDGIIERSTLAMEEAEALIVHRIFELAAKTSWGGVRIYKALVKEFGGPIMGRGKRIKGQPVKPSPLSGRGVNAILRNRIYKGLFRYNDYGFKYLYDEEKKKRFKQRYAKDSKDWVEAQHEDWRIVSDELWDAAQQNREVRVKEGFGHGPKRASYLLTGFFNCSKCSNSVGGHWQYSKCSEYHYYRCRGAMNGEKLCDNKAKVRGKLVEAALIRAVEAELIDNKIVDEICLEICNIIDCHNAEAKNMEPIKARIVEISQKIQKLTELAMTLPDLQEVKDQLATLQAERNSLSCQLNHSTTQLQPIDPIWLRNEVCSRLNKTASLLKSDADLAELRTELKNWVGGLRLDPDGSVWMKWNADYIWKQLGLNKYSQKPEQPAALGSWYRLEV